MKWYSAESSSILRWAYNSRREAMAIAFHNGSVYIYRGVPAMVSWGMEVAASKGKYFHRILKRFPCQRVV